MNELIESLIDKETGLSERETYFLDILFSEAGGDIEEAMKLAGYPKSEPASAVRKKLSKHIKQATKEFIVAQTPKAAMELMRVFQDPSRVGNANVIKVAENILNRGDVNKEEAKFEMPENVIVLLPPKKPENEGLIIDHDSSETEAYESE